MRVLYDATEKGQCTTHVGAAFGRPRTRKARPYDAGPQWRKPKQWDAEEDSVPYITLCPS